MVIINWNVGAQVARCTLCQLEAGVYNDLGCHNNGKDFVSRELPPEPAEQQ